MPTLDEPESESPIKALLLGNSGSGKTGALISLARAGYNLHIADFDKGTSILRNLARNEPDVLKRIEVEVFTDKYKNMGARVFPYQIRAWAKAMDTLTTWTTQYNTLDHIVVVDSLNFATKAAFNWVLQLAGRLQAPKEIQDWLAAQDLVESFLYKLYGEETQCHVIMTSHIQYYGTNDAGSDIKVGYPMTAVGRSFSPKVPRFFNTCVLARTSGTGQALKREIWTAPIDFVDLKAEAIDIKKAYPLDKGLAGLFQDIRKTNPLEHTVEGTLAHAPLALTAQKK